MKERIEAAMEGVSIIPFVKHVQEKIEGAVEWLILSGAFAKQRVHDLSIAEQERSVCNDPDNHKIVQKYGEIYVYQGRADIAADDEEEAEVINMYNVRLAKPWRKKYIKIMKTFPDDYWVVLDTKIRYREHGL
jgi:hypothetical protein